MNTQAKVALNKQDYPERYCKEPRCLWKVMRLNPDDLYLDGVYIPKRTLYEPRPGCPDGRCPKHQIRISQLVQPTEIPGV